TEPLLRPQVSGAHAIARETFGRSEWHGRETVPQQELARHCLLPTAYFNTAICKSLKRSVRMNGASPVHSSSFRLHPSFHVSRRSIPRGPGGAARSEFRAGGCAAGPAHG